jgi:XTP/dITP diphosphohydrolase
MQKVTLCFATNNAHKLEEVMEMLPDFVNLKSLKEIGCFEELPENQKTIEGNALEKAKYIFDHFGVDCFADDTGLEVSTLGGLPGVDTAHYAGPERDSEKNMNLLLKNLSGKSDRSARFKTVFALIWQGETYCFEGIINGKIAINKSGSQGFGYDPIFIPEGFNETFAELGPEIKNTLSHRALATRKLVDFFKSVQK